MGMFTLAMFFFTMFIIASAISDPLGDDFDDFDVDSLLLTTEQTVYTVLRCKIKGTMEEDRTEEGLDERDLNESRGAKKRESAFVPVVRRVIEGDGQDGGWVRSDTRRAVSGRDDDNFANPLAQGGGVATFEQEENAV